MNNKQKEVSHVPQLISNLNIQIFHQYIHTDSFRLKLFIINNYSLI